MEVGDKVRMIRPDQETVYYGIEKGDIGIVREVDTSKDILYVDFSEIPNYIWVDACEIEKVETYGKVTYEGRHYHLIEDAEMTNRLTEFPYVNAPIGELYEFEMSAPAIDENGVEYTVYWEFTERKGQETSLDELDYSNPNFVESKY